MPELFSDYHNGLRLRVTDVLGSASIAAGGDLSEIVVSHVHFAPEGPGLFSIKVCHSGVTPIRYDLTAALVAALGLVGGIIGANPVSAAAAVLTCLISLKGIRKSVTDAHAYILLALHDRGGSQTVGELGNTIRDAGRPLSDVEVRERLFDLAQLDAISIEGDIVRLEERVIVRYTPLLEQDGERRAQGTGA
jgi:hypothetical protein